jgi:hypothetical protein
MKRGVESRSIPKGKNESTSLHFISLHFMAFNLDRRPVKKVKCPLKIESCGRMTLQPNPEFADQEARNRISELEECIRTHNNRIASLESRLRQEGRNAEEFDNAKQQIAFLDTAIAELKEENATRVREHQNLTSSLASIEKSQEEFKELKELAIQRPPLPLPSPSPSLPFPFPLGSIESDLLQLKAALTEKAVLPERSFSVCDDRFDGIIAFLTRDCGGNVADRGIVGIRSSSFFDETCPPKNAADFTPGSGIFNSKTELNQWIEWDFKRCQIEPTHYSIRTHRSEAGTGHLRNWVIEGRNEEEKWIQLDERRDDSQLNGPARTATFEIANRFRFRFGILRLRQIGFNHRGTPTLAFSAFEFFGDLFRNTNTDPRSIRFDSIESDLLQLKTALIEKSVFPERFVFQEDDRLNGIIAFLTRDCGGNIADCGIVGIRSNSFSDTTRPAKNAADFAWSSLMFQSKNEPNQWIEWDFKTSQIEPTHYSIRTHGGEAGSIHLRNWVIEGRNEEEKWIQLDERRDDSQLNGRDRIATFEIANRFRFRILRLRQIGFNHRGTHVLAFAAFELFGDLFRHSSQK